MKWLTCLPLFLLLLTCNVFSQQDKNGERILFRGVILSASTGERLAGSRVFINRSLSGIARDDGTFSFFALKRDTVVFDMMGYKPSRLIVADSLRSKEFLTGIYLQTDTTMIDEVVIIPNLAGLKAEMMNPPRVVDQKLENARSNLNMAAYQGMVREDKLGDPASNYDLLRQQQKTRAYERGGIPSDRMVALSPLMLLPAAYLLLHGPPEIPQPPARGLSQKEIGEITKRYFELLQSRHGKAVMDTVLKR